jgi:hypothetical protein
MHEDDTPRPPRCSYEDARIAFDLPTGWDDARVSFAPPNDPSSTGITIAREHTTDPLRKRVMSTLMKLAKQSELLLRSREDIVVGGRPAKVLHYEAPGDVERSVVLVDTASGGGGESLVVTWTTSRARHEEMLPVFAHVLKSVWPVTERGPCAPRGDATCRLGSLGFAPPPGWRPRVHARGEGAEIEVLRDPLQGSESLRTYADRKLLTVGAWRPLTLVGSSGEKVAGRPAIVMRFHEERTEHTVAMVDPADDVGRNAIVFYLGAPRDAPLEGTLTDVLRSVRFEAPAPSGRVISQRPAIPQIPIPGVSYR